MNHTTQILAANTALFAGKNPGAVEEFFTPDYLVHLTGQDLPAGNETIRKVLGTLRRSFPDLECAVEILVEGKDRVAWQRTLSGTHKEAFKGFPARGGRITWRDMVVSEFRDGLIVEEWVVTDLAERLLLAQKKA